MQTVLLIEDSKLLRLANESTLRKAGYRVLSAADGEEALSVAHNGQPDVILLDILLPKISGEAVLRQLKEDSATAQIPVVVLSGLSQANAERLQSDGAADFLEKSKMLADPQCLLHAIERILGPITTATQ
ncbi:MAG TPA: response regulator [Candidatus Saccharimonadales bacterium]|jgi:CheY-like chemotaxis protein|nr:response regulator [Candidatus Saccharimonadales bacterium]